MAWSSAREGGQESADGAKTGGEEKKNALSSNALRLLYAFSALFAALGFGGGR